MVERQLSAWFDSKDAEFEAHPEADARFMEMAEDEGIGWDKHRPRHGRHVGPREARQQVPWSDTKNSCSATS